MVGGAAGRRGAAGVAARASWPPPARRLGTLLPEAAEATGLPPDCVVGVGGHDHICGLLALGADAPGVLLNSLGTAEALTLVVPRPSAAPELLAAGINQGLIRAGREVAYLFGGLPTSAACVEWFRSLWPGADHATLIAEAEAVPPGAHEVMFLPQLRLGSPPYPDPVARGGFVGLSECCDRGVLFRALLEGMALDSANQLGLMRGVAGPEGVRRVVATGGGTRNPLLLRLKASLFGLPVEVCDMPEGTCLGAALLGGLAAGIWRDLDEARAGLGLAWRSVEPDCGLAGGGAAATAGGLRGGLRAAAGAERRAGGNPRLAPLVRRLAVPYPASMSLEVLAGGEGGTGMLRQNCRSAGHAQLRPTKSRAQARRRRRRPT